MVTPEHHVALVDRLVQRSEPVRPLWPVRARFAAFLAAWSLVGAAIVRAWPRPDLTMQLHVPLFVTSLVTLIAASGLALVLALRSAVPGRAPTGGETTVLVLLVATTLFALVEPVTGTGTLATGAVCGLRTLVLAALPWGTLLVAIRRGAPVHWSSAAAYAGGAALLASTAVLRATCPESGTVHWLVWHLGTVAVTLLGSTPLVAAWLRTWRRDPVPN